MYEGVGLPAKGGGVGLQEEQFDEAEKTLVVQEGQEQPHEGLALLLIRGYICEGEGNGVKSKRYQLGAYAGLEWQSCFPSSPCSAPCFPLPPSATRVSHPSSLLPLSLPAPSPRLLAGLLTGQPGPAARRQGPTPHQAGMSSGKGRGGWLHRVMGESNGREKE